MSDQHFEPGPPVYVEQLDEDTDALHRMIARLIQAETTSAKDIREFSTRGGGQTDATGALVVRFEYPQGFAFHIHRINLEAVNPATGQPYAPNAPYTSGYVAFWAGDVGFGGLLDFAPPSPGANVFPQISTDGNKQAAVIRGERLTMQVSGGPALAPVFCRIGGRLERL